MTDFSLVKKYNVAGPRYTSYPTALQFTDCENKKSVTDYLKAHNTTAHGYSLYIHIPFCQSLCWYCGCSKVITQKSQKADIYLDYLEKEMKALSELMNKESLLEQLHFGGGTPTFLTVPQIEKIGEMLHHYFKWSPDIEFGVEIDPRALSKPQVDALIKIGMNRASLGVQDTTEEVQKAINRIQPLEKTAESVKWLRDAGIESINFDLIYGLPAQTKESFAKTMQDAYDLGADRLAIYSYAHLPHIFSGQRKILEQILPTPDEKLGMLMDAIAFFSSNGYRHIGMDHFAKESDELVTALDEGKLQRNFQGYSTHSGKDLYGIGMTSISLVGDYYFQNAKDLDSYYAALDKGESPIIKDYKMTEDDRIRRHVIMSIMCKGKLDLSHLSKQWEKDLFEYFDKELNNLEVLIADKLIEKTDYGFRITEDGKLFVRNIAMKFDAYYQESQKTKSYSKTV